MKDLIETVEKLKKSDVKKLVDKRIKEFKDLGKKSSIAIFKELCYCILTANFSAERAMEIHCKIGDGFLDLGEADLAIKLRECGYRFPNKRAKYIVEARKYKDSLKHILNSFGDGNKSREWLDKNIKGLGYKESSHFLRNIGYDDLAIIDFHIIDLLVKYNLIEKPKTIKKAYLDIENLLRELSKKLNITLAELDLYLWYLETGKILK